MRRLTAIVLLCVCASFAYAQNTGGELKGKILDKGNNEPLPFVNMILEQNGNQVAGGSTDFDGKYTIKPIPPGKYDLKVSYVGYKPKMITGIQVNFNKITFQDVLLESSAIAIEEFEVIEYSVPLIDKDGGASGQTVTREDIEKMPGRSALSIATTVGGVFSAEGSSDVNVRGSRSDGTYYYIDGIKVRGTSSLPKSAIEQVSVITGGLPANYGDATGGIISVTTRGASSFFFGGLEFLTSGFAPEIKLGNSGRGLGFDPYGYRLVEGSLSGPLWMKKDEEGKKTTPLLGFFLSGNYQNIYDGRPLFDGTMQVKDDVRAALVEKPFAEIEGESVAIYNTDFLSPNDFDTLRASANRKSQSMNLAGKIDVNLGTNMNLTFGGSAFYSKGRNFSRGNTLFNTNNNGLSTNLTWRAYTRFTQRFADANQEEQKSSIKNAFYTVMVDYSKIKGKTMNHKHEDDLFSYGYVGRFRTYKIPTYGYNPATFTLEHNGWRDTLVEFTPSAENPELAAITSQYYTLFDETAGHYENITQIEQGKGLLNGDQPESVYGLWSHFGTQFNGYSLSDATQFRVTASGSADVGDHAISLGFEYEQRSDRFFSVSPVRLWNRLELLVNNHVLEIDTNNVYIDDAGSFKRATYGRLNAAPGEFQASDAQAYVDYNLRLKLGLDPDGTDWVDAFAIDPEVYSLDMFSADELLNDGNNIVAYYGYDHTGKKLRSKPSFDDFFKGVDEENGNINTRLIPAFEPIYIAGYIMDKFAFDDIIFNVGVRVDRFDANQMVPKDPYSLHETVAANEQAAIDLLPEPEDGGSKVHPNNFGEGYVVYVNNLEDPTQISGYRRTEDNVWFNADGEEINDPSVIESSNGIAPLLVNKDRTALPNEKAFEDYTPQLVFMPRIAFSFPISDEATFFAHYDKLSQRPTSNQRLDPIGYYYLQNVRRTLSNPNLKPQKTTEYELGFQQVLTKSSSLKISAFYREQRDMIQALRLFSAYPADYTTYGNIDFGTVKGATVTYDLRRTGNVWMKLSYTLQFAEGTGSGSNTGLNLANTGQPNLVILSPYNFDQRHAIIGTIDYRYGSGTDYNGPILFNKPIFENTGINMVTNVGSGLPYSRSENIFIIGGQGNLVGTLNGSNLPWTIRSDVQIDRDFPLAFGKDEEKKKKAMLNVYFQINNVFNIRNITGVHRATGNPDDDGYLNSAQFQPVIEQQRSEEAYRMYYAMNVNNPFNWGIPRTIRLGMRFSF